MRQEVERFTSEGIDALVLGLHAFPPSGAGVPVAPGCGRNHAGGFPGGGGAAGRRLAPPGELPRRDAGAGRDDPLRHRTAPAGGALRVVRPAIRSAARRGALTMRAESPAEPARFSTASTPSTRCRARGLALQCRIKGKKLREAERSYNPIAPGDIVERCPRPSEPERGNDPRASEPRRTRLVRWNKKGRAPQVLAANADLAVCVTSPAAPPFRPAVHRPSDRGRGDGRPRSRWWS